MRTEISGEDINFVDQRRKGRKEHFDLPQNGTVVQGLLRKYKIQIIIIIIR